MEIKITKCRPEGISPEFANLTPDSVHTVLRKTTQRDCPRGYWVQGVGDDVLVLASECVVQDEEADTKAPKIPPFLMGKPPGVSYGTELISQRIADATNLVDTNLAPFVEHSITLRDGGGFKVIVDDVEYVPKPSEPSYSSPTATGKIMDGMEMVKHVFSNLTAEQRVEVFNGYCCVCGSDNPMCPCEDE